MKMLRSFETSGITRTMTRLSHRGRSEPFETSLCETQISNCWTWFILTLHESAGTRDRKTLQTRCGSFKPRIQINTIFISTYRWDTDVISSLEIQKKMKRRSPVPRCPRFEMSIFVLNTIKCPLTQALVSFSDYLYNNRSLCAIARSFPEAVTDVLKSRASRNFSIQSSNLSADICTSTMSETSQIFFLYFSPLYNTCYFLTVRAMCVVRLFQQATVLADKREPRIYPVTHDVRHQIKDSVPTSQ